MSPRLGCIQSLVVTALLCLQLPAAAHDPDARIQALTKLIAKQPSDAVLYVKRGELWRQTGHLARAFRDYEKATRLKPDLSEIRLAKALAFLDMKNRARALRELDAFLLDSPRHGYALLIRARTLRALDKKEEAARAYDKAIATLSIHTPEHFIEQAQAHVALGADGYQRAVACLESGVREIGRVVSLVAYAESIGAKLSIPDVVPTRVPAEPIAVSPGTPIPTTFLAETRHVLGGSTWRYLDDGSNQGTAWRARTFDDSKWASGRAQLGYGDGDETTVVGFGPNSNDKFITTYFRHSFQVANLANVKLARVLFIRDDGAVVYLNGTEVARSNMPGGAINHKTAAANNVSVPEESRIFSIPIDHKKFRVGQNVIAVEIHQSSATSSDISFDLELRSSDGIPAVTRGPYLQRGTPGTAIIRWRTDYPTQTAAFFGPKPGNLTGIVHYPTPTTEHVAVLTGLQPDTVYQYGVGTQRGILVGGPGYEFRTPPKIGTKKKTRIWAIGDSGTKDANAAAVRDAYLKYANTTPTNVWLMLGDNAYDFGTDDEYQLAVFDMYPKMLRSTFLWPTLGNHDALTAQSNTQAGPYYDMFSLPTKAEAGGVASGTEAYYSFDHGDVHFICLNSADVLRSPSGAMVAWLAADLTATKATWVITYFHHPPYSKGSHDSDNPFEIEMTEMRQNILPFLERGGVDLVLTGHSHCYERSLLLDGHYSDSSTLRPGMVLDRGNGRVSGDGAYAKRTAPRGQNEGTVYAVAGASGKATGGTLDHRAMVVSLNELGSMVIDVDGNRLEGRYLSSTGAIRDEFTIIKGLTRTLTRDEPTVSIGTGGAQNLSLEAGSAQAGLQYQLAGSLGTVPGFNLGPVHVPLNPDPWFTSTLILTNSAIMQNTRGFLDFQGRASARISVPPLNLPTLIGTELHHAFLTFGANGAQMASNTVKLTIVK